MPQAQDNLDDILVRATAPKENTREVPLDVLRKLCDGATGSRAVRRLNEIGNVFAVSDDSIDWDGVFSPGLDPSTGSITINFSTYDKVQGGMLEPVGRISATERVAMSIYHENYHSYAWYSPIPAAREYERSAPKVERELAARHVTERWLIQGGMPEAFPGQGYRVQNPDGSVSISIDSILGHIGEVDPTLKGQPIEVELIR